MLRFLATLAASTVPASQPHRLPHDAAYRRLFAHPRMMRELLQGFCPGHWRSSGRRQWQPVAPYQSQWFAHRLQGRTGDLVWRVRAPLRGGGVGEVYVLLEFQSKPDPLMPVRCSTYVTLFLEALAREGELTRTGLLPAVLPVVIYNGTAAWRYPTSLEARGSPMARALRPNTVSLEHSLIDIGRLHERHLANEDTVCSLLFQLERLKNRDDLPRLVASLDVRLHECEESELRRDFAQWILHVLIPSRPFKMPEALQAAQSLSEVRIMLAETVQKWYAEERQAGRVEGRQEGRQEGQLELLRQLLVARFGAPLPGWAESRLQGAEPEALANWAMRCLEARRLEDVFGDRDRQD